MARLYIYYSYCSNEGSSGSRTQALQKLWLYLISKVSVGVLTWNIVITRFGKPSSAEIKGIIMHDIFCYINIA